MLHTYVTEFWNTDQIATLGLFHFIGLTNGYTFTLHIYSAITRLGWLVCFFRKSFVNPVNLQLRQWDPWRALHGKHGSEIDLSGSETSPRPFKFVWAYGWYFLDSYLVQTVLVEGLTRLLLSTLPTPSSYTCHSWYYNGCEKVAQYPAVLVI